MKKKYFVLMFVLTFVLVLTSCNKTPKRVLVEGTKTLTVNTEGLSYENGLKMDFSSESELYTLGELEYRGTHSSVTCNDCGYSEFNGEKAYKICNSVKHYNGFSVNFNTALKADSIAGITITFMTTDKVEKSEVRVTPLDVESRDEYINTPTYILDGENQWKTINIGISNFKKLANDDGDLKGFKFYVYNKDDIDFYLKDITLKLDTQKICDVNLSTTAQGEEGACADIANQIKSSFEGANLSSEITVNCEEYLPNTTTEEGKIVYSVDVKVSDVKTFTYNNISKTIPALKNAWLDINNEFYAIEQDIDSNWKSDFTNSGTLLIDEHEILCTEGIKSMQYAILDMDSDYKSEDVKWYDVTCKINNEKITDFAINAYLDYADTLENGKNYKFYVRALTNNDNYILHLVNEFKYETYSDDKNAALKTAFDKIKDEKIYLSAENATTENVSQKLNEILNSSVVKVVAKKIASTVSTSRFAISVTYNDEDFSNCMGEAFQNKRFIVWHNETDLNKSIMPLKPEDGQTGINIASKDIYKLSFATFDEFTSEDFGYKKGENCTPVPVEFEWSDIDFSDDKTYTLCISENLDMSNAYETKIKGTSANVYNLKAGTKYYWKVVSGKEESPVFSFKTLVGVTRFISAEGIQNFRDIGGYVTKDNMLIKQGMLYRAAELDKVKDEGKNVFIKQLGITTDLDLRESNKGKSPVGSSVKYKNVSIQWYNNIFENTSTKKTIGNALKTFAKEKNYPICFHCSLGRDRTGTISILLLGLLGVDEETIIKEYYMSLFSEKGFYDDAEFSALQANINAMWSRLDEYGEEGDTINQKIEAFVLETGVTEKEIETIRSLMLEEIPEDYYDEDIKVDSSNITNNNNKNSKTVIIAIVVASIVVVAAIAALIIVIIKKRGKNNIGEND